MSAPHPPDLPDWLSFLTPRKPKRGDDNDENPFQPTIQPGMIRFPSPNTKSPKRKDPHLISGRHSDGNFQEEQQTLVKDISPLKLKDRQQRRRQRVIDKENDSKKGTTFAQWFLLLLWVSVAYVTLSTHESSTSSSKPIVTTSSHPPPAISPPPIVPRSPPKQTDMPTVKQNRRPPTVKYNDKKIANTAKVIPKRIVNIIKQELAPFPTKTTDAISSSPQSPVPSLSSANPSSDSSLSNATNKQKRINRGNSTIVPLTLQRVRSEILSKTERIFSDLDPPMSKPNCENHSWKWILDRKCRRQHKERQGMSFYKGNNNRTTAATTNDISNVTCDNLFSRECRIQKRLLVEQNHHQQHQKQKQKH